MNYEGSTRYLLSLGRELAAPTHAAAARFNLENIRTLTEGLGRPDRRYVSAHIAGTNGKGSTAAFLESILRQSGLRTGLYTSPHLERINERIRVNGREISDDAFAESFSRVRGLIEVQLAAGKLRAHPTFFECVTAMAMEYFAREKVEVAVFETGLGGRLDSTNVLQPAVTIITRIDFDHENFLGNSLREIAAEKAGILKPRVQVIVAPQQPEALAVILGRAADLVCPAIETSRAFRTDDQTMLDGCVRANVTEQSSGKTFDLRPRLAGRFQLENVLNAVAAARSLGAGSLPVPDPAIVDGIAAAEWPGRLEQIHWRPDIYLDGAHNPGAARELARFWREIFPGRRIWLIYGTLRDKAVDEIAGVLFPLAQRVIITEPRTPRAVSAGLLAGMTGQYASRYEVIRVPEKALDRAMNEAEPGDAIFVTGSLYLVGEVRSFWKSRAAETFAEESRRS